MNLAWFAPNLVCIIMLRLGMFCPEIKAKHSMFHLHTCTLWLFILLNNQWFVVYMINRAEVMFWAGRITLTWLVIVVFQLNLPTGFRFHFKISLPVICAKIKVTMRLFGIYSEFIEINGSLFLISLNSLCNQNI